METVISTSWHSYGKIFSLGHAGIKDLLLDPVNVSEKLDGSQCSFGLIQGELRVRSKGAELNLIAPEKMFTKGVEVIKTLPLHPEWTYRAEYFNGPAHNVLHYDRIPNHHLMVFDVNIGQEEYLSPAEVKIEAERLGLESVPILFQGILDRIELLRELLETTSILGGQKIEGVVIKNYSRFGKDGKALMGKFVSEEFKEIHAKEWGEANPKQGDIIQLLVEKYRTPARWNKAIQHLKEKGLLENSPKDIGLLIKELGEDLRTECEGEIKEDLYKWAIDKIVRGATSGLPQHYKELLMKSQFTS